MQTQSKSIRFSDVQKEEIKRAAASVGVSAGAFIRLSALAAAKKVNKSRRGKDENL